MEMQTEIEAETDIVEQGRSQMYYNGTGMLVKCIVSVFGNQSWGWRLGQYLYGKLLEQAPRDSRHEAVQPLHHEGCATDFGSSTT